MTQPVAGPAGGGADGSGPSTTTHCVGGYGDEESPRITRIGIERSLARLSGYRRPTRRYERTANHFATFLTLIRHKNAPRETSS